MMAGSAPSPGLCNHSHHSGHHHLPPPPSRAAAAAVLGCLSAGRPRWPCAPAGTALPRLSYPRAQRRCPPGLLDHPLRSAKSGWGQPLACGRRIRHDLQAAGIWHQDLAAGKGLQAAADLPATGQWRRPAAASRRRGPLPRRRPMEGGCAGRGRPAQAALKAWPATFTNMGRRAHRGRPAGAPGHSRWTRALQPDFGHWRCTRWPMWLGLPARRRTTRRGPPAPAPACAAAPRR
jgi:hypothetical protein